MYGLAAIEQANGWAMAVAGACIVLSGLSVLSFLISLLPRIPGISDTKPVPKAGASKEPAVQKKTFPERLPEDLNDAAMLIIDTTCELGESFTLIDLHCKCKEAGLPNPHMAINSFRQAGLLKAIGDGQFSWQPISK